METFTEYSLEIEGLGLITVLAPEGEAGYRVKLASGQVTAFAAVSGEPSEANAAADIAHAIANPPPFPPAPMRQETRVILDRLTPTERAALLNSENVNVKTLVAIATATGAIREDDPAFPGAVALLDALDIIEATRWPELFAP